MSLRPILTVFRRGVLSTILCAAVAFIALVAIYLAPLTYDFVQPPAGKQSLLGAIFVHACMASICIAAGHLFGLLVAGQWSRVSPCFRARLPVWAAVLSITVAILAFRIVPRSWELPSVLGLFATTAALITAALPLMFPRWIITSGRPDE